MATQYCVQCGTQAEAGARFCINCGAPQAGTQPRVAAARQPAPRISLPVLLLIFGGLLMIGGIAVYLFNYSDAVPAPVNTQSIVAESEIPYPNVERISLDEAKARSDAGTAVLLDVRPAEDYQALHVANAISIPLTDLPHRHIELDKAAEILTYCT